MLLGHSSAKGQFTEIKPGLAYSYYPGCRYKSWFKHDSKNVFIGVGLKI